MQSRFSQHGFKLSGLCAVALLAAAYQRNRSFKKAKADETWEKSLFTNKSKQENQRASPKVDLHFWKRFWNLLKIMIPGILTPEFGYVILAGSVMIARTLCDIWMIKNGTDIESAIIGRDIKLFRMYLLRFFSMMLPISIVNALLRYSLSELHLRFRERLSKFLYTQYMTGFTYYKISNLDTRIQNCDQILTQDLDKFCGSVSELYSNVSKPILDIAIYATRLSGSIGAQGPSLMLGYLAISGIALTTLRRPLSRYTVTEQQLEGDYRYVNSRLLTNSEEVAFYVGNKKESRVIKGSFDTLVDHLRKAMQFRFGMGIIDNMIAKYIATVVGYTAVSTPFLDLNHPRHLNSSHQEIMTDYYQSGRMLVNLASAVGRLILAGRELTRLSGFTSRVTDLIDVLRDLNKGSYKRTMVSGTDSKLKPGNGKLITKDYIINFENVPVVTPNGDVLVEGLNFEVKSGTNVLISGPNGCGKSSLFRILGGLWPLWGGTLTKPGMGKLFYVPQRPYMTLGTLRDQVIYPHTKEDMAQGVTDQDLLKILEKVKLEYIVQ